MQKQNLGCQSLRSNPPKHLLTDGPTRLSFEAIDVQDGSHCIVLRLLYGFGEYRALYVTFVHGDYKSVYEQILDLLVVRRVSYMRPGPLIPHFGGTCLHQNIVVPSLPIEAMH